MNEKKHGVYGCLRIAVALVLLLCCAVPAFAETFSTGRYQATANLVVFSAPNTSSGKLQYVPAGTEIEVEEVSGDWGYVHFKDKTGWISLLYCKTPEEASPEDKQRADYALVADLSGFQAESDLDWNALKAGGVEYAILRIGGRGYGPEKKLFADSGFQAHAKEAAAAGVGIGVYFTSYAFTAEAAAEEAAYVSSLLKSAQCAPELPVFIHVADVYGDDAFQHETAGKQACTAAVEAFCAAVEKEGLRAGVFCSKYFAEFLLDASVFSGRTAWISEAGDTLTYKGKTDIWQYTANAAGVAGYTGTGLGMSRYYREGGAPDVCAANAHVPAAETVVRPATCTEDGAGEIRCAVCGTVLNETEIPSCGHTWDAGKKLYEEDGTDSGVTRFTCLVCGAVRLRTGDVLPGDVDLDGKVSAADARLALRAAVGLFPLTAGSDAFLAADADGSGAVSAGDARSILRAAVGLEIL